MLPALEAILGHKSAHSLATGPVMAEPADTEGDVHTRGLEHGCRTATAIEEKLYLNKKKG